MDVKKPNFIVVGLALFSMFFGSGNLIFPLTLGRDAGADFAISALGFVLTAVLIPCFGVVAIAFAEGDYEKIFMRLFNKRVSLVLIFIILLSFIPFGAGPRCVILAHSSLRLFLPMPGLPMFSLFFLAFVGYLVYDKSHVIKILGTVLTPLLLSSIAFMVISAVLHGEIDPPLMAKKELFFKSLFEGYNTQDLLSSLFFSSSLIILLKENISNKQEMIKTTLKGALVGILLLTCLYVVLILASSLHSDILVGHSGIDLVAILAHHTMGNNFGAIAGAGVAVACLTTAVALILAFSQFLANHVLKKELAFLAVPISLVSVYLTALLEFDGIMMIISPMMKLIYPVLLIVVMYYLFSLYKDQRRV